MRLILKGIDRLYILIAPYDVMELDGDLTRTRYTFTGEMASAATS
jgi:hypothetical protein